MEIITLQLTKDSNYYLPVAGNYFRLLSGTGKFSIDTDSGINSTVLAGLGCDLRNPDTGKGFTFVNITALDNSQTVQICISAFPVTDSRLTGSVDLDGVISVVNAGGSDYAKNTVTVNPASAVKILDQSTTRASATIQIDGDLHIWKDNTVSNADMSLGAAHHKIENTAELWAYNDGASAVTVKVLEELK